MRTHALFSPSSLMSTAGTVNKAASSASDLKRALRSSIRKKLRSLPAAQRRKDDMDIQNLVLDSSWFKSARRLCAYISCQALREVDTTRILSEYLEFKGSGMSDVSLVLMASEPVDVFLLPGLAFDRQGRRLGRGGGYYDVFLRNYLELVKERKWKKPLLIALAYSLQILDENEIPVTCTDVSVDAVVSPSGLVLITPATFCEM